MIKSTVEIIKKYAKESNSSIAIELEGYLCDEPFPYDWCCELNKALGSPLSDEQCLKLSASDEDISDFLNSRDVEQY